MIFFFISFAISCQVLKELLISIWVVHPSFSSESAFSFPSIPMWLSTQSILAGLFCWVNSICSFLMRCWVRWLPVLIPYVSFRAVSESLTTSASLSCDSWRRVRALLMARSSATDTGKHRDSFQLSAIFFLGHQIPISVVARVLSVDASVKYVVASRLRMVALNIFRDLWEFCRASFFVIGSFAIGKLWFSHGAVCVAVPMDGKCSRSPPL